LKNGKFFTVESSQKASFSQILPLLRQRVAVPGKKFFFLKCIRSPAPWA